jgi:hypothetical protein
MREAKEIERLRLAETLPDPVWSGVPSKLQQACLVGVQIQRELRETLSKRSKELLGVGLMLKSHQEVIGKADNDDVAVRMT